VVRSAQLSCGRLDHRSFTVAWSKSDQLPSGHPSHNSHFYCLLTHLCSHAPPSLQPPILVTNLFSHATTSKTWALSMNSDVQAPQLLSPIARHELRLGSYYRDFLRAKEKRSWKLLLRCPPAKGKSVHTSVAAVSLNPSQQRPYFVDLCISKLNQAALAREFYNCKLAYPFV
jgi:hypothetical protein